MTDDLFANDTCEKAQQLCDSLASLPKVGPTDGKIDYAEALNWLLQYEEAVIRNDVPDWMPVESWLRFVKSRRAIGKPMTKRAEKRIINNLGKYRDMGHNIAEMIQTAADRGWADVYPPKGSTPVASASAGEFPA